MPSPRPAAPRLPAVLRRFGRDRAGMAAVEFAMVLPLMLALYLGGFELSQGAEAWRKVGTAAQTIGNIVTNETSMSATKLDNIFNISGAVMIPFPTSTLSMLVTAEKLDADGKCKVHWARSSGTALTAPVAGTDCTPPAELASLRDTYFVVTTASYTYKSATGYGSWIPKKSMTKSYTFRPRKSAQIAWE